MLQCINNGVSSTSGQTYNPMGTVVPISATNSLPTHVNHNVPTLHQNAHRSPEIANSSLSNNASNAMSNCTTNNVSSIQDFNFDLFEQNFPSDLMSLLD